MRVVDAVTHHHPVFLKSAYRHGDMIKLHNTADTIRRGNKYIEFDPLRMAFNVRVKINEQPKLAGIFNNIESAMFHARRR